MKEKTNDRLLLKELTLKHGQKVKIFELTVKDIEWVLFDDKLSNIDKQKIVMQQSVMIDDKEVSLEEIRELPVSDFLKISREIDAENFTEEVQEAS